MFWHRKPKPDPWAVEVRKAQHELRCIERELATFDHRSDMDRTRRLAARHYAWSEFLRSKDIPTAAFPIEW